MEDEEIGEEEGRAAARSKEWFQHNQGIPFGQAATDLSFTMEQIRSLRRVFSPPTKGFLRASQAGLKARAG